MSDANQVPSDCQSDEELKQALLAAFGDDDLSLLEDDEEIPADLLAAFGAEIEAEALVNAALLNQESTKTPAASPLTPAERFIGVSISENDSPRTRWMKNLSNAIYSGRRTSEQTPSKKAGRFVVFSIAQMQFGLPFADIREIARYPKVTALPCTPPWLRGVANFRGQILSVTDLRNLIRDSSPRPAVGEKVIVVYSEEADASTALVVDRVTGIRSVDTAQVDLSGVHHDIATIGSGTLMIDQVQTVIIDPNRLMSRAQLDAFA